MADRVIIREWRDSETQDTGLDAFLPDWDASDGKIVVVDRIGGHGEAVLDYYYSTRLVDYGRQDVKEFVDWLRDTYGYDPVLRKRLNRPFGGWAR